MGSQRVRFSEDILRVSTGVLVKDPTELELQQGTLITAVNAEILRIEIPFALDGIREIIYMLDMDSFAFSEILKSKYNGFLWAETATQGAIRGDLPTVSPDATKVTYISTRNGSVQKIDGDFEWIGSAEVWIKNLVSNEEFCVFPAGVSSIHWIDNERIVVNSRFNYSENDYSPLSSKYLYKVNVLNGDVEFICESSLVCDFEAPYFVSVGNNGNNLITYNVLTQESLSFTVNGERINSISARGEWVAVDYFESRQDSSNKLALVSIKNGKGFYPNVSIPDDVLINSIEWLDDNTLVLQTGSIDNTFVGTSFLYIDELEVN
ncbi:hypothetical protein FACS1894202_08510 [Clostridia bacterium]|nr:hypothetical protein FACS1894202_08510 [Clostridia bacterium]